MNRSASIWQALTEQAEIIAKQPLRELFEQQAGRADTFSLQLGGLYVDYSRNKITADAMRLLFELAAGRHLQGRIADLFGGAIVNHSEGRAALHTLLRAPADKDVEIDGQSGWRQVDKEREKMYRLCQGLQAGVLVGASGKPITRLVNIGIGGSDLGPRLVLEAMSHLPTTGLGHDFIASLDPAEMQAVLRNSDPETTLFVIVSKSFTTLESLTNARAAKAWLQQNGCADISKHFIGVSENARAVSQFGISSDYYLRLWPWVGGRYSVWSCAGFIICAVLGEDRFKRFLAGAHCMDQHFSDSELEKNLPVVLGLLGVWYSSLLQYPCHAVVPYAHNLRRLPDYLSQLVMESNGKSITHSGQPCEYPTAPTLWGGVGSNAQHAFFQLLHQGTIKTSLDLIAVVNSPHGDGAHELLFANCIAQGEALMQGKPNHDQPCRHFPGDRPSTTVLLTELSPYTLGALLALYEHKTFVEAVLWDINPFDQWGVELGKQMAKRIGAAMAQQGDDTAMDATNKALLAFYRAEKC